MVTTQSAAPQPATALPPGAMPTDGSLPIAAAPPKILHTDKVTVSFDGFKAIQDLDFSMQVGELRFLIGPNGAGKTTLLDVICGKVRPTQGHAYFKGNIKLDKLQEHRIALAGVGRKFQTPSVFVSLTVLDNLELAMKGRRGVFSSLRARLKGDEQERIMTCLQTIGLEPRANELAGSLSHGEKQWLEIGMILVQEPDLMLLDEPAAGMTDKETHQMGELLQTMTDKSILIVEHDMEFVRNFARTVTVMHEGKILREGTMDEVQNDPKVAEVYLGRRVADVA